MNGWSVNRLAGRAVALHAPGAVVDKRELLEMLGLVAVDGHEVLPDDRRNYHLEPIDDAFSANPPAAAEFRERDRKSTSPPGLANLPPAAMKAPRPGRTAASSHGSWAGREFHTSRSEPQCADCRDFYNTYQRGLKKRKAEANGRIYRPRSGEVKCGTERGWSRHRRLGEQCAPCQDAARAAARQRRRRRNAAKWTPDGEERTA